MDSKYPFGEDERKGERRAPHNKMWRIILATALLFFMIVGDVILKSNIESSSRQQARYQVEHIEKCVGLALWYGITISKSREMCSARLRTTFTGDGYFIRIHDLAFMDDKSRDVPQKKILYFTEESIGVEFKKRGDWDTAVYALPFLVSGLNSQPGLNISLNYDGKLEWVEWGFLSNQSLKYNPNTITEKLLEDNPRTFPYYGIDFDKDTYNNTNEYVYVQGVQSDEAYKEFIKLRIFAFFTTFIIAVILISSHVRRYGKLIASEDDFCNLCSEYKSTLIDLEEIEEEIEVQNCETICTHYETCKAFKGSSDEDTCESTCEHYKKCKNFTIETKTK